jgi:hypothetical protein
MKCAILAVCCLVALATALDPDTVWVRVFDPGGNAHEMGKSLVVVDGNALYVAGTLHDNHTLIPYWAVRRYTLTGDVVWTESLAVQTPGSGAGPCELAYSPAGILVVGGTAGEVGGYRRYLHACDTTGQMLWSHVFTSAAAYFNISVAADDAANAYMAGQTLTDSGRVDYLTVKVDSGGIIVWQNAFGGSAAGTDLVGGIAVDALGGVYVAGGSQDSTGGELPTLVKYDSDGELAWVDFLGVGQVGAGSFQDITSGADGDIYVAGQDLWSPGSPGPVARYRPDGDTVWCRWLSGRARRLCLDDEGSVCATGITPDGQDIRTWKLSPDGGLVWERTYDGPSGLKDEPEAITTDRFGNVIVVGLSVDSAVGEPVEVYATLVYSAGGELLRDHRYRHMGSNYFGAAQAVGTDSEGCIYLTGRTKFTEFSIYDWLTIKYPPAPSGVEADKSDVGSSPMGQTICRGVLSIGDGRQKTVDRADLLDITGRKVKDLLAGENDIRHLAPGVYFVRTAGSGERTAARKIVIQN